MDVDSRFDWVEAYERFADALVPYRSDRQSLIEKVKAAFRGIGPNLPKLDSDQTIHDMDPFTVMGLFNKHQTASNRAAIMEALGDELGWTGTAPSSFDGVPLLNNQSATFYRFHGDPARGPRDVDDLWEAFCAALVYADEPGDANRTTFIRAFDAVRLLKGNRWKLTMALYWARPRAYLTLDGRSRWYLANRSGISSDLAAEFARIDEDDAIPAGADYLRLRDAVCSAANSGSTQFSSFPELSDAAFSESQAENDQRKAKEAEQLKTAAQSDPILTDEDLPEHRVWAYSPGPGASLWDELKKDGSMSIGWGSIGDLNAYDSKDAMRKAICEQFGGSTSHRNDALATWQFLHDMQPGDLVFAKRGQRELIGAGLVLGPYEYGADANEMRRNRRRVRWLCEGCWPWPGKATTKVLTDITPYGELCAELWALVEGEPGVAKYQSGELEAPDDDEEDTLSAPAYGKTDFLADVYMDEPAYDMLAALVWHKQNVILEGAPGTGKTYSAKRLAYSLMEERDPSRVRMVQFHQGYSYEDFIEGYRPTQTGFELRKGAFYEFCKIAEKDEERPYFFIIDEINRGNLSKILGELFMLIESDKRGVKLRLMYSGEQFSVPKNLYLIGTMNTADRSIALMDFALRRRFGFFGLKPGFGTETFRAYERGLGSPGFDGLVRCVEQLNEEIARDDSLGPGYVVGHSFLSGLKPGQATQDDLLRIVDFELVPLLREYWFDDPGKTVEWARRLRGSVGLS